jgi:hypothetical protein
MRRLDEGLEFEVTPEYKNGGLIKGIPKLAKKDGNKWLNKVYGRTLIEEKN